MVKYYWLCFCVCTFSYLFMCTCEYGMGFCFINFALMSGGSLIIEN